jgi:hypothetical protein
LWIVGAEEMCPFVHPEISIGVTDRTRPIKVIPIRVTTIVPVGDDQQGWIKAAGKIIRLFVHEILFVALKNFLRFTNCHIPSNSAVSRFGIL